MACRETTTIPLNLFTHVSFIIVTHCMGVMSKMGVSHLREWAREQVCDSRVDVEGLFWGLCAHCPVATEGTSVLRLKALMLSSWEIPMFYSLVASAASDRTWSTHISLGVMSYGHFSVMLTRPSFKVLQHDTTFHFSSGFEWKTQLTCTDV